MRLIDADALNTYDVSPAYGMTVIGLTEEDIELAPTIDAVPVRHGKWIYGNDFHWYTASCSACGYQRRTDIKATGWNQWKYCPHCGAKMDGEE